MHPRERPTEDRAGYIPPRFPEAGRRLGGRAVVRRSPARGLRFGHAPVRGREQALPWPGPTTRCGGLASGQQAHRERARPRAECDPQLYNWEEYIYKKSLRDFEKQYTWVTVEISTFSNMDGALTKLRSGQVDFDILIPRSTCSASS